MQVKLDVSRDENTAEQLAEKIADQLEDQLSAECFYYLSRNMADRVWARARMLLAAAIAGEESRKATEPKLRLTKPGE